VTAAVLGAAVAIQLYLFVHGAVRVHPATTRSSRSSWAWFSTYRPCPT
jgi:hypothetical protein